MKTRFTSALFTLGALLVLFACSTPDNDTLASIDGKKVALEDFTAKNPASRFADKDHAYIDEKVDEFVRKELFSVAAIKQGFGKSADIQEKKEKAEKRQMLQHVYNKVIMESVITDDLLKEIYDRSGTEIHARHILLQFKGTARSRSDRTKTDALAVMGQINNRLSKGESFEKLAEEFTDDPSGKTNGGDLGWFGWGKMVGPFQETAFKLTPGEVSDVVETDFGYHIIKLEAKRDIERGSFEDEKNAIRQQASREKGAELGQKATAFLDEQKETAGFKILTDNVHTFYMIYDKSSFKQGSLDEVLQKLNFSAPLFLLRGDELGSDWIISELKSLDSGQKPRFTSENQLLNVIEQMVTQYLIVDYGYNQKFDQDKDFSDKINDLVERYAYDAFIAEKINENLKPSEEQLLAFYEANKESKYLEKKKVQVREIFVKDSLQADVLKKRIDAGELIDLLARRYTERKATKDDGGLLPPFQEGRYGSMGKAAFTMEVGEVRGPIKLGNGFSIIKLEQTLPEGPKPYDKVKGRVRTEIVSELRDNRMNEVFEELEKDYSVKINYGAAYAFYDNADKK